MGRSAGALFLSDEERGALRRWRRSGRSGLYVRAGIVLDCAAGLEVTLNRRSNKAPPWRVRRLSEEPGLRRDFIHRVWRAFVLYLAPRRRRWCFAGTRRARSSRSIARDTPP